VDDIWRALRDPRVSTTLVFASVVLAGFLLLALGWRGVAATLFVVLQLPWAVSGSFAGMAVIGAGLALLNAHLSRSEAAAERAALAELQREALRALSAASAR
jgi:hypothetical protein